METTTSARHIASDPAICHGEPTFRGTRIRVADVLEQVESGVAYEAITEVALRDRQAMRSPKQSAIAREAPAAYALGLVR
ncbi:MAG: DUF433 domain-containing protein [Nitrospiraceae bacterium]|nr:DUF433 domain-containing protein [Nitrospiraceae bacterium]